LYRSAAFLWGGLAPVDVGLQDVLAILAHVHDLLGAMMGSQQQLVDAVDLGDAHPRLEQVFLGEVVVGVLMLVGVVADHEDTVAQCDLLAFGDRLLHRLDATLDLLVEGIGVLAQVGVLAVVQLIAPHPQSSP
jgi:hypothetical protein